MHGFGVESVLPRLSPGANTEKTLKVAVIGLGPVGIVGGMPKMTVFF